ncbi:MAG: glycosyltransferase family 39 protein [Proteobacteria bacterium]|nr:glycosyltransferase family 39 protein [Pseudomonadota bacterium]
MTTTQDAPAEAGDLKTWTYERAVFATIAALVLVRLIVAANMPLAGDEALYWRYSRYLAPGYLDHPAMNPFFIRLGTMLFGDTAFGVRLFAVLTALPATWAIWRSGAVISGQERIGATAALFFNLTITMGVGSMLATSDASVVMTSCFVLLALAKLNQTDRGIWWLAVGLTLGVGMWAKYTTAFFAFGIALWLLMVPDKRKWFFSPWPYLGAIAALLVFAPVLMWNANHEWASVAYQSSRFITHQFKIAYPLELLVSQIGLATPSIFILAVLGVLWSYREPQFRSTSVLFASLVLPVLGYFLWHSLHERVQGNWPECITPALVCAAAMAVHLQESQQGSGAATARWSNRLAVPVALLLVTLVYAQAIFGLIPLRRDPTSRLLGGGWPELAQSIDLMRERVGAQVLLTTDYTLASALTYYLPSHAPAEQMNDRVRWANEPPPPQALFAQQMLYVCKEPCRYASQLGNRFADVERLGAAPRMRRGVVVERYSVYRVRGQVRPTLDPMYPIRTKASDEYVL